MVKDKLIQARSLLETKGWCKNHYAMDADLIPTGPRDPEAAYFCMLGACRAVMPEGSMGFQNMRKALQAELPEPIYGVAQFNDEVAKSKADVLAIFDKAIAHAS